MCVIINKCVRLSSQPTALPDRCITTLLSCSTLNATANQFQTKQYNPIVLCGAKIIQTYNLQILLKKVRKSNLPLVATGK